MKKIITLSLILFLISNYSFAQSKNYQLFRMDITPHVTNIPSKFGSWGGGLAIDPKFNITDNIAVGLRLAETFFAARNGIYAGNSSSTVNLGVTFMTSYGLVGEYFFTTNKFRPYAGLSFRKYSYVSLSESASTSNSNAAASIVVRAADKWGLEPELGLSFPGIRFSVSYNYLFGGNDIYVSDSATNSGGAIVVTTQKVDYSHISFKLGFTIAGRKKQ